MPLAGACPGFLKGGGPISLGSLKKGHQILKRGSNGLMGGTNMYFQDPLTPPSGHAYALGI